MEESVSVAGAMEALISGNGKQPANSLCALPGAREAKGRGALLENPAGIEWGKRRCV